VTLRVAVINRHPDDVIGGSELQCDLFARGLVGLGHHVTYLAMHAATMPSAVPTASRRVAGDHPYTVVPLSPDASRDAAAVAAAVRAAGADVVYWRMNRPGLAEVSGLLAAGPHPIPVVLAVAHVDDVSRWATGPLGGGGPRDVAAALRQRIAHRRSWRTFRTVAGIAAQREDFVGRVPVPLQRHVPNVVDPTAEPFAWPRPYVAWVANLKPRKRPELLVPLAEALAPHGVDLIVVGGVQDDRYAVFAPGAAPADLPTNLHPLGLLPPAAAAGVIAGARCLAVTTRPEGLSNAMLQAWWHGVPTVSLDYDPDGLIVREHVGAVCGGDVPRFQRAVVRHATDAAVRLAAGERATAMARERFALETNVQLLEELLAEVARRGISDR
jgi:hypothetical protein